MIDLLNEKGIVTFSNGRYSHEIRKCIMNLVGLNVSIKKVTEVIKVVLGNLTNIDADKMRLPSVGAKKRFLEQAHILAQCQVAEEMIAGGGADGIKGNCLHGDGTTKYSRHYESFQVTTTSGRTLSLGLSEVVNSDAESLMKTFLENMSDISDIMEGDKEKNLGSLVASIKNTMSDRAAVNPLFQSKLNVFRNELLPKAIENWDNLSKKEQEQMKEMVFFCHLHLLSNFATETSKVLKGFEKCMLLDDYENKFAFETSETTPIQLIRLVSKAFHPRGSDESGVSSYFNSHLKKIDQSQKNKIDSFIGNRFNVIYRNGAAVYFHKDHILDFLKEWPHPNNLLKAVNELIDNPFNLACIRALGIVDKILTGPFWRIIEGVDHILVMNKYLSLLKAKLDRLYKDARPILNKQEFIFDESDDLVEITRDDVYEKLFEETGSSEFDELTCKALEQIFYAILLILQRQAKDQLDGGIYGKPSKLQLISASNVPAHNKASESDFAIFDLLIRLKPSANTDTIGSLIMWSRNKTGDWLDSKSPEERTRLMDIASASAEKMKLKHKERKIILLEEHKLRLDKKQVENKEIEMKQSSKMAYSVNTLVNNGMAAWISVKEAEDKINLIDPSEQYKAVGIQLDFYKNVIFANRNVQQQWFSKSKDGIKLTFYQLFEKLTNVIQNTIDSEPEDKNAFTKSTLKPLEERNNAYVEQQKSQHNKMVENRFKIFVSEKSKKYIPMIIENPNLLVGCKIKHKVKETKTDEGIWQNAEVIEINKHSHDKKKTEYSVKYDNDSSTYSFKLIDDMENKLMFLLDDLHIESDHEE